MKKLVFLFIIIILLIYNVSGLIEDSDFSDLDSYDVFILKTNNLLNNNNILDYFTDKEILVVKPNSKYMDIYYDGLIDNLSRYYVDKLNDTKLLINYDRYRYEKIDIEYIKVYTSYRKIKYILNKYPSMLYSNTIDNKLRKYNVKK